MHEKRGKGKEGNKKKKTFFKTLVFYSFRVVLLQQDVLHEDETNSPLLCLFSRSMIPSEKMNQLVALKMIAICRTIHVLSTLLGDL